MIFVKLIYFESTNTSKGGAEREGERENPKQAPMASAGSDAGLKLTNHEITT